MLLNHTFDLLRKRLNENKIYELPVLKIPDRVKYDDYAVGIGKVNLRKGIEQDILNHEAIKHAIGGSLSHQQAREQDAAIQNLKNTLVNNKLKRLAESHGAEVNAGYYKPDERIDVSFYDKIKEDFLKLINSLKNNNIQHGIADFN